MQTSKPVLVLLICLLFVSGVSAYSDYCLPPVNQTIVVDHQGIWYNITVISANDLAWVDAGFGNISGGNATGTPPVASFEQSQTVVRTPEVLSVTDTSSNTPIAWWWDWGDGSPIDTTQNPSHSYTNAGTFYITLTATNVAGSSSISHGVWVGTPQTPIPGNLACPTSAITAGLDLLGVCLLIIAAILVYTAFGGIQDVSHTRVYRSERRGGLELDVDIRFLIGGILAFVIGAIMLIVSLAVLGPLISAAGC